MYVYTYTCSMFSFVILPMDTCPDCSRGSGALLAPLGPHRPDPNGPLCALMGPLGPNGPDPDAPPGPSSSWARP